MCQETEKFNLMPCMIFAYNENRVVETILGSCVSVCIYDQTLKIGGMNHYMLPVWNGNGLPSPKYGNIAIDKLIDKIRSYGAKDLTAKVFGGANQLNSSFSVGQHNVQIAYEQLKLQGINIIAENVGGNIGRKIIFNTHTGVVQMKFLSKNE